MRDIVRIYGAFPLVIPRVQAEIIMVRRERLTAANEEITEVFNVLGRSRRWRMIESTFYR